MTLIDLALQFKDFEWAERITNINIEPMTEMKDIPIKNTIKPTNYSSSFIKEELKRNNQLEDYIKLISMTKGLDMKSKIQLIKNLGVGKEEDIEQVLIIMNDLEK